MDLSGLLRRDRRRGRLPRARCRSASTPTGSACRRTATAGSRSGSSCRSPGRRWRHRRDRGLAGRAVRARALDGHRAVPLGRAADARRSAADTMTPAATAAGVVDSGSAGGPGQNRTATAEGEGFTDPWAHHLPNRPTDGGDEGTRTPGLRDANAALSQLSYIPTGAAPDTSGGPAGKCSTQVPATAGPVSVGPRSCPGRRRAPYLRVRVDPMRHGVVLTVRLGPQVRARLGIRTAAGMGRVCRPVLRSPDCRRCTARRAVPFAP